jgi:hypothetical protein
LELDFDSTAEVCQVIGSGENRFGVFHITGTWSLNPNDAPSGTLELHREYEMLCLSDDESVGSESEHEQFDPVKPIFTL